MHLAIVLLALASLVSCTTFPLKRIEVTREQKAHLRGLTKRDNDIPLQGGIATVGLFYASIELGTPPQPLNVQVDTGSSDLLVYGAQCKSCGSGAKYNFRTSSSYAVVPCDEKGFRCSTCEQFNGEDACSFSDYYGDGTGVNGSVITDMLTVGTYSDIKIALGNIQSSTQNFEPAPVDGIWGVSYPDLAITKPAIFDLFTQAGVYKGYGLCLGENPSMSFGEPSADFQFTPITQVRYFDVQMNDLQVNGVSIGQSNFSETIVDSGTTLLLLPPKIFAALYQGMLSQCDSNSNLVGICGTSLNTSLFGGQCFSIPDTSIYPTLTVVLQPNIKLDIPPSAYLLPQNNQYCLGIAVTSLTILGDVFMQNFNVFFDIQNSQVGFADPSSCPSTK